MSAAELSDIIQHFETESGSDLPTAVRYLTSDVAIARTIRTCLSLQIQPAEFDPSLFQWLYSCVQQKKKSGDLYNFVVQFSLDIILVYFYAVYENQPELKASSEALLMVIIAEAEKDPSPPVQIHPMSKHLPQSVVSQQAVLTEAMLQRHNETEYSALRPSFAGKPITVNNRLSFLSSVVAVFSDRLMLCPAASKIAFCNGCVRLSMQGADILCGLEEVVGHSVSPVTVRDLEALGEGRRYSVSDELLSAFLHGVRMCLFHSCHEAALQALYCLKARAEYELLPGSMQVSGALIRLSQNVKPTPLDLDMDKYSTYTDNGKLQDPTELHTLLQGHILKLKQRRVLRGPQDSFADHSADSV
ncbi:hypothetical protein GBAR_LOCUS19438 [Geodia barretti]|uniref:Uncharacterized protein n=1 Tax=Geodia barretti TaxID=519541 RepID=A0AA35X1N9_GEOBA|nr:hypothetical protein GBAR_LOCUS19438 [Geodia barretti]